MNTLESLSEQIQQQFPDAILENKIAYEELTIEEANIKYYDKDIDIDDTHNCIIIRPSLLKRRLKKLKKI